MMISTIYITIILYNYMYIEVILVQVGKYQKVMISPYPWRKNYVRRWVNILSSLVYITPMKNEMKTIHKPKLQLTVYQGLMQHPFVYEVCGKPAWSLLCSLVKLYKFYCMLEFEWKCFQTSIIHGWSTI